ncbi:tRNA 4-thiouridine(8) synthase ThiI [Candidatus Gracilibacteria bacterium]|nr:MAG: tRNA 4-thiouridine(8) synthase ThiI [Candidatus Gracilibacteria bacterium]
MKYIIKPFSEIMIKSRPVRKKYLNKLTTNINLAFRQNKLDFKASFFYDKIEINNKDSNNKDTINNILSKIPGVEIFLEVDEFQILNLKNIKSNNEIFEEIFEKTKDFYLKLIDNKSFVVRAKRSGIHNFTSMDLERYIGGRLLSCSKSSRVKLKKPEVTVQIELKDSTFYIVKKTCFGIGGYPTGTQDKVLSLLSGGFDSGVSSFSMMKRGCKVDFLFFNLGGNAHEIGVKQLAYYLSKNFSYGHEAKIITINFEEVIANLLNKINHRFRGILLKRFMLKVADKLAKKYGYYALIKGDSLGQVSSQTLKNMYVIDKASETLVLRPLISFNKQEIINTAQKIGTYDFARSMPEYCGIISDKPATGARLEQILKEENLINEDVLNNAIENAKTEFVNDIIKKDNVISKIELTNEIKKGEVLIDIRDNEKKIKNPLSKSDYKYIEIPFFELNSKFPTLKQDKNYLFYCDKGVLSHLHALYLKDKGYNNIKVFRKKIP